ncbi:MAG: thioredoxin domain-containing protein [Acidobacteriia bacterium]|nr:thioredoxin domain-containing protein [Terriglobia bacterium]
MFFLLLCLLPAQTPAPKPRNAFDKQVMADYVRHLVPYGPQVAVVVGEPKPSQVPGFKEVSVRASLGSVSEDRNYFVSDDGQKILTAAVYDVKNHPFKPELDKLKTDFQPSIGTPGAPVVVVIFSDFECAYCREEAKMLREKLVQAYPTEVRLYFKDFPLAQIHPWARPAALAGRCIFKQKPTLFWDYHDYMFENQAAINATNVKEKIGEFARSKSLNVEALNACVAGKAAEAEVDKSLAEGRSLNVGSTPTLFINGRRIAGSIKWEGLQQLIDIELGYQRVHKNAGEHCCQVTLSTPFPQK